MSSRNSSRKEGINVRDEREFKLWVKFILSIQKDGGDINKPLEILWKSVNYEFMLLEEKEKASRRFIAS
jgi:hypothetical protein